MAVRLTALRDIRGSLKHVLLQTIDQVTQLGHLDPEACPHTVVAHTRWASVGEISVPNCHPVEGDRRKTSAMIHVCLNGDIDNY